MNFATHFDKIYEKATGKLNRRRQIRGSIEIASAEKIFRTMIMPGLGYCGSLSLGWPASYKRRIRNIEHRGIQFIDGSDVIRSTRTAPIKLHGPPDMKRL